MSDLSLTFTYHPLEYSLRKNPKAVKYFKIKKRQYILQSICTVRDMSEEHAAQEPSLALN